MKKLTIPILLILSICFVSNAYASSYSHSIKKIASSAALWISGSGMKVPALAVMQTGVTAGAQKWIPLLIPQTRMAKITASAIMYVAGAAIVGYGGQKIREYMESASLEYRDGIPNNAIQGQTYNIPSDGAFEVDTDFPNGTYSTGGIYIIGVFATQSAASDQMISDRSSIWGAYTNMGSGNLNDDWAYGYNRPTVNPGQYAYFYYMYPRHEGVYPVQYTEPTTYTPAEMANIESGLNADLGNDDALAIAAAKEALDLVNEGLINNNSIAKSNPSLWSSIQNELNDSITEAQKLAIENSVPDENTWAEQAGATTADNIKPVSAEDVKNAVIAALLAKGLSNVQIQQAIEAALEAKADLFAPGVLTPAEVATAVQNALAAQQLSKTDVQDAVKTGVAEAVAEADVALPPEPEIPIPDKLSLTTVLQEFWNDIQSLDIFNSIRDIDINTSGATSQFCIGYPALFGQPEGEACFDFAPHQAKIAMLGDILFAACCIGWLFWLFM